MYISIYILTQINKDNYTFKPIDTTSSKCARTHTRSLTCTHIRFKQAYMYTDTHAHCSYVQMQKHKHAYNMHTTQTFARISAHSRSYTRTLYALPTHTNTHARTHARTHTNTHT